MNLPFFIARRYFFSSRKKNFIQILGLLSMLGVGVGTMALVIVLSVFNGLQDLISTLFNTFDPQIKVCPLVGKSFLMDNNLKGKLKNMQGIATITEVAEDNVLLKYQDAQMVVKLKGVSNNFLEQKRMDSAILLGELKLWDGTVPLAIMGVGIYQTLGISLADGFHPLQFWYPKTGSKASLNPENAFYKQTIAPASVFHIEPQYDDRYIFVPLTFALNLFHYGDKRTALEIKLKPDADLQKIKARLKNVLGAKFSVLDSDEQHASLMRILKIEKLFVFLALAFIVVIASFNIFVSLGMLVLDKRRDISILAALGADASMVKKIFLLEGCLIAFSGAFTGLVLGFIVCLLQQTFGIVGLGMESAAIDAYPVKMVWTDFAGIALFIIIVTLVASIVPANRAAKGVMALKSGLYN